MDLRGFLVRCHRLQRNYSQEGLCRGICAVSYLSKLEQGKVQAADEIYQALFHRLGIVFQENEEWLAVWKEKLQELASSWFYGEQREAFELEKQMENLLNSPLCVDALLIKALYTKEHAVCFSSIYAGCTAVLVSFSMCGTGTSKQGGTNSFSDTCPAAGSTEIWRVEYFISDEGRCVCAYGGLFSGAASPSEGL